MAAKKSGGLSAPHVDPSLACAIYTRKSSEEGLEQDFNSLHAQREACEAFVLSQKSLGWTLIPTAYDDGGEPPRLSWRPVGLSQASAMES